MPRILYLDDMRVPTNPQVVLVRNYDEFVEYLSTEPMPDVISFDHDLALEHLPTLEEERVRQRTQEIPYHTYTSKTGLDCVRYVIANKLPLKGWQIHSSNPVGSNKMYQLLSAYCPEGEVDILIPANNMEAEVYSGKAKGGFRIEAMAKNAGFRDADLARFQEFKASLKFPLTVYRAFGCNPHQIDYDNLGCFWTVDEKWAQVYYGDKKHDPTVLRAVVNREEEVDWEETYLQNVRFRWDEKEVYLKPGASVELTGIRYYGDWEQPKPEQRFVTAADKNNIVDVTLYHATNKEFDQFDVTKGEFGIHFGPEHQTKNIGTITPAQKRVIPVKLNINNPLRLTDWCNWTPENLTTQLVHLKLMTPRDETKIESLPYPERWPALRQWILAKGYDGIIYLNRHEGLHGTEEEQDARIEAAGFHDVGDLSELDDAKFLKVFPEAQDSYIALTNESIRKLGGNTGRQKWYHGTSKQNAEKILKDGYLRPGMPTSYNEDIPRYDAVYVTSNLGVAADYAGTDGLVLEVAVPNLNSLLPDEDTIAEVVGDNGWGDDITAKVRGYWLVWFNEEENGQMVDNFDDAWALFQGQDEDFFDSEGAARQYSQSMIEVAEYIAKRDPQLAKTLIAESGKAAHIGALKVVRTVKTAATDHNKKKSQAPMKTASSQTKPAFVPLDQWKGNPAYCGTDEDLRQDYDTLVRMFSSWTYPLTIYRALRLQSVNSLRMNQLGINWTWSEKHAYPYWGEDNEGDDYVLKAICPESSIDWDTTLEMNICGSEEEITVKANAPLQLVAYKNLHRGDKEWTPFAHAVTASADSAETPKKKQKGQAYTAYELTPDAHRMVLQVFSPKFPDVVAHHITVEFGLPEDTPAPATATVQVVGYAADESLEALVVSVNGSTTRPDGKTYHLTLSLDRSKGRKPVQANEVVAKGWEPIEHSFEIPCEPKTLTRGKTAGAGTTNLLYHGTSEAQFSRMKDSNFQVQHLYLGEDVDNICGHYAEEQARRDNTRPVILTIDADKLPDLKDDVHSFDTGEDEIQVGQYLFSGDLRPALLSAKVMDDMGDWLPLHIDPKTASKTATALTLPAGTKLYRGIGEEVIHPPKAAMDGCLWFAQSKTMARTYIPAAGLEMFTGLRALCSPPEQNSGIGDIQKQLGYEYTDIDYKGHVQAQSWHTPKVQMQLVADIPYPKREEYTDQNKYYEDANHWQTERETRFRNWVMARLREYGYEPDRSDSHNPRYRLKLTLKNGQQTLLPNKFQEGSLLTFENIQPLKIYDMTEGGRREGDLMEPDYHQYEKFSELEKQGYDGVKINDFAQVEGHGNFGHTAIGVFQPAVAKLKEVGRETTTHPEDLYADMKKQGSGEHPWTVAEAQAVQAELQGIGQFNFDLRGSIKEQGYSNKDVDFYVTATDEENCDWELVCQKLAAMGYEWIGNTNYGETWVNAESRVIDIFFEEPDPSFKTGGEKTAGAHEDAAKKYQNADEFVKYHYTGHIPSSAYERMGFDLFKKEKYPILLKTVTLNDGTEVEFRKSGEKLNYTKVDDESRLPVRGADGLALMLSDEEIKQKGYPEHDTGIHVFTKDGQSVAYASDEWGADGVWVRPDFQKKGLGVSLLATFREQFKPERRMGQMTPAGESLARGYYKFLTKNASKTAAPRCIYYHGSPFKNLRSILSQGLIAKTKGKNWDKDDNASLAQIDRTSYGGTYVSRNLMTAASSPRDHHTEGRVLVVCMELQPNTFYLDEDDLVFYLTSPLQQVSDNYFYVLPSYLAITQPNIREDSSWKSFSEECRTKFIDGAIAAFQSKFERKYEPDSKAQMHPELEERVRALLPDVWLGSLMRNAAHIAARSKQYDVARAYRELYANVEYDAIPDKSTLFPTPQEGEAHFRAAVEKLTRAMRLYARPSEKSCGSRETARIMEPIGYNGSNHIIAVIEMRDGRQYRGDGFDNPTQLIVHYGQIPQDFFEQYKERYGSKFVVSRPSTKTGTKASPEQQARWKEIFDYSQTHSLAETGKQFRISRERVRQVLNLAQGKSPKGHKKAAESVSPKYLYHNAPIEARESILKHGLLTSMSNAAQMGGIGGIFFDNIPAHQNGFDTWRVDVSGLPIEPDETTDISEADGWDGHEWFVLYGQDVPPERLKLMPNPDASKTASASRFPTFAQVMDSSTDTNNEFMLEDDEARYQEVLHFWQAATFPLTVYRALALREGQVPRLDNPGQSWSLDRQLALEVVHELFPNREEYPMLEAQVQANDIDWLNTFRCWMTPMGEKEVRVRQVSGVKKAAAVPAGSTEQEYPLAGATVGGLKVRNDVPNMGSISASLTDYTVLDGIRAVPMSEFTYAPPYSVSEKQQVEKLVEAIKASGEINPVIVVLDSEGAYILEGGHRYDALHILGVSEIPALVVKEATAKTAALTPASRKLWHGTSKKFDRLTPNDYGLIWLGEKRVAKSYGDMDANFSQPDTSDPEFQQSFTPPPTRLIRVTISPKAKVIDLRDTNDPLTREFWIMSKSPKNRWKAKATHVILENTWAVPWLREKGVDAVVVDDSDGYRDHESMAVLNPDVLSYPLRRQGSVKGPKHTREMAEQFIQALEQGTRLTFEVWGSVESKGFSYKDIDLVAMQDDVNEQDVQAVAAVMQSLGFQMDSDGTPFWDESLYFETWYNAATDIMVDVFYPGGHPELRKQGSKIASPDYGSQFNDKDAQLQDVTFRRWNDETGSTFEVFAYLPSAQSEQELGWIICCAKTLDGQPAASVSDIFVREDFHGTGLGQMLYDKAIALAKEFGYKAFISGNVQSAKAISAWEKRLSLRYPVERSGDKYVIKLAAEKEGLPPEPGTAPIPPGTVRLYHYTKSYDNLPSIKQDGLLASKARGDDGSGYGPSAGVWASSYAPERGHLYVEFWAYPDEISHRANYPDKGWRNDPHSDRRIHDVEPTQAELDEWSKGHQHVIMNGDVPPDHFVAIHEPWHHHARYLLQKGNYDRHEYLHDPAEVESLEQMGAKNEAKALAYVQSLLS